MNSLLKLLTFSIIACAATGFDQNAELRKLASDRYENKGDILIHFDPISYRRLVVGKPQKYHLFLVYTANMQICRICKPFVDALERAALSYREAGKVGSEEDEVPVFFGVVDVGLHQDVGRLHNMNTLPHIVHVNGASSPFIKGPGSMLDIPNRKFPITKLEVTGDEMLDWVNKESRQEVALYYTQAEKVYRAVTMLLLVAGLVFGVIKLVLVCRRRPSVIAIVGLVIYYISTSGIFYNLLHGMSWVGVGQGGSTLYLFQGSRGQYLGEGLAMSALTVISGVSLYFASRLPYSDFAKKADTNSLATRMLLLVGISAVCLYAVIGVYILKVGWYSEATMFPPPWYRRGPLRIDQGNTF